MHIIDAQVHLNQLVEDWRGANPDSVIATAIATLDAIGVDRVLIAESRGFDANMRPALGPALPNSAIRAEYPFSERAVTAHPHRFAYLCRIDLDDPDLERVVAEVRTRPGARCMRRACSPSQCSWNASTVKPGRLDTMNTALTINGDVVPSSTTCSVAVTLLRR